MVTPTKVRAGRVAALLAGVQAAKGTPVSNFTTGSAGRLWDDEVEDAIGPLKSDPTGWNMRPQVESGARYTDLARPHLFGFSAKATPFSLEMALRSNWGPYAAGEFTLAPQVTEWLSLVLVEDGRAGADHNWHRVYDAFIHSILLKAGIGAELSMEMDAAAERTSAVEALNAPGGTFGPSAQLAVGDRSVFPGRLVRLFRDPEGDNEELAWQSLELSIDQGLGSRWDQMRGIASAFKRGHPGPLVTLSFEALVGAETWAILSQSIAEEKSQYRLTAEAQSPAKTLTVDLYEVDFEVAPIGRNGQEFVRFRAVGQAHRDDLGNFVTITLA